ncbi:MAG: cytochrome b5 domain-containing protein [Eubacteriales bacterium]
MKKTVLFVIIFAFAAIFLTGCASSSSASSSPASQAVSAAASGSVVSASAAASGQLTLTKEQLAKYNGQNGQPSYVAVNGVIYDVSAIAQWAGGQHQGGHSAGQDLTAELAKSPHGAAILSRCPVVGKLVG